MQGFIGRTFGLSRIVDPIGAGGMGVCLGHSAEVFRW